MPIPTVFRPIRSNDIQIRPFKAYKSHRITYGDDFSGSGYRVHNGLHNIYAVHVDDSTYNYPTNSIDNTNQHVIWRTLDHRYYRYPYDSTRCHELTNPKKTEKYLHYSASILTIPYFYTGESIKPGSVTITGKINNNDITLTDDGNGNLRDNAIISSSFVSSSNLMFFMSFDNEYRQFEHQFGTIETGTVEYILNKQSLNATVSGVEIQSGIIDSSGNNTGLAAKFTNDANYIRVPHNDQFNKFNATDNWSISFWYYVDKQTASLPIETEHVLISKYASRTEQYVSTDTKVLTNRYVNLPVPASVSGVSSWDKLRTPFHIEYYVDDAQDSYIRCVISNGNTAVRLVCDAGAEQTWHHITISNTNGTVRLYCDFTSGGSFMDSVSLPTGLTSNTADIIIGNYSMTGSSNNIPVLLDEIRFYDYGVLEEDIASLSQHHYLSGSLYQTNVAGNIFYRNGQIVISSAMPKYNSGSGFFNNNNWTASWKSTHTIYENEIMVHVPADQFNYTLNPTATYRPASTVDSNSDIENNNGPGVLFKSMFTSSYVSPYITTIGLYNDKAQLLAIGKLAQPVQKRDDIDTNIIVRWDF